MRKKKKKYSPCEGDSSQFRIQSLSAASRACFTDGSNSGIGASVPELIMLSMSFTIHIQKFDASPDQLALESVEVRTFAGCPLL